MANRGVVNADLFAFLTTDANGIVGSVHPKTTQVILTNAEELETRLTAPVADALSLQRPLEALGIVARGARTDPLEASKPRPGTKSKRSKKPIC